MVENTGNFSHEEFIIHAMHLYTRTSLLYKTSNKQKGIDMREKINHATWPEPARKTQCMPVRSAADPHDAGLADQNPSLARRQTVASIPDTHPAPARCSAHRSTWSPYAAAPHMRRR